MAHSTTLRSVLVADDDPGCRESIAEVARREGLEVFEAACAADAVELATRGVVDLTIFDVHLPDFTGLEACRRITVLRAVPAIFVTGEPSRAIVREARLLGALTLLIKPVDLALWRLVLAETRAFFRDPQPGAAGGWERLFDWERFEV